MRDNQMERDIERDSERELDRQRESERAREREIAREREGEREREGTKVQCFIKKEDKSMVDVEKIRCFSYGCKSWSMSIKDEKHIATTERGMVRRIMGMGLLEHLINKDISEEAI